MSQVLYSDDLVSISDDSILFRNYYFPYGSKTIELSSVVYVKVVMPTLLSGRWRIHGTGDFRTWFPRDTKRPGRDRIFILHRDRQWFDIGFTAENSTAVLEVFKSMNLLVKYEEHTKR